jgi:hypothetical protein
MEEHKCGKFWHKVLRIVQLNVFKMQNLLFFFRHTLLGVFYIIVFNVCWCINIAVAHLVKSLPYNLESLGFDSLIGI